MRLDELIKDLQYYKDVYGQSFNPEVKKVVNFEVDSIDVLVDEFSDSSKEKVIILW
jgi:hypothetical protein